MWRFWVIVLVTPVVGEEECLDGEDVGCLEWRLDDGRGFGALAMRSKVKGAEVKMGAVAAVSAVRMETAGRAAVVRFGRAGSGGDELARF